MNACNQTSYASQNKPDICKSEEPIRETNMRVFQGYIVWEKGTVLFNGKR